MDSLLKNNDGEKTDQPNEPSKEETTKNFPQYLAASAASMVLLMAGTVLGWSSPVLPKLMTANSTLPVNDDESTWIGSLVAVGAIFGPFPAGIIADAIGRKRGLLAVAIPFLVSWCVLAAASSVGWLYLGRIIAGVANGWGMTLLPMYIGEIATPNARGALGMVGQIMITLGFLYVYIIGPYVPYVWTNVLCGILPVAFFVFLLFMPESPFYELSKNNHKSAAKSLRKLRGKSADGIKDELNALQAAVDESVRQTGTWIDLFSKTANKRAVLLMGGLMAIQQFSGVNVVLFYSESIFQKAGSSLSPSISTIVVGLVMFIASFPTPYLIEKLGRRMVLILSSVGMMISQGIIGSVFFFESRHYDTSKIGWLPLLSILGYITSYSIGIGPVPWAMIGELFAPNVRSKGAAFSAAFSWFLAFVMTKSFGFIMTYLGSYSAFWIFSVCCGLGGVFVYFLLPETKGKTLDEIQEILNKK
ncbi:UNVERIFIED_CONTAM: hypothetical protein PYX00_009759 [Menopon gallinae]|uniref:Major facilitator superfamily (MFS) profile domain-containing protein n=1 Tax=Menopon gallinae TaxID=328185 RepID=A0AAW2HCV0_9NEOP